MLDQCQRSQVSQFSDKDGSLQTDAPLFYLFINREQGVFSRGNSLQTPHTAEPSLHAVTPCRRTYCPPQVNSRNYRGILFPSMLILTAPCGRCIFLCSAKRRLCFSSRLMPFLQLYRRPITAQLMTSLPVYRQTPTDQEVTVIIRVIFSAIFVFKLQVQTAQRTHRPVRCHPVV